MLLLIYSNIEAIKAKVKNPKLNKYKLPTPLFQKTLKSNPENTENVMKDVKKYKFFKFIPNSLA